VQAQCSQCSARIQIDDAKVPDKPFKVKCPKCQAVIALPGKAGEAVSAGATSGEAAPAYTPPPAPPSAAAVSRRERAAESPTDAIIALPAGPAATALQAALAGLGYHVDSVADVEEGAQLIEQGLYEVAVTSLAPTEPGKPETLAQRLLRLGSDARRRLFVILVGEEFRTADGTQAWVAQADLVVHPSDAGRCEHLIRGTLQERKRLYQPMLDARHKIETD
jgi:predicted Zn finger-like uncharacterized protein